MKNIIALVLICGIVLMSSTITAQNVVKSNKVYSISDISIGTISGADTLIEFYFAGTIDCAFSINIDVSDTIKGGDAGLYLEASDYNHARNYIALADSIKIEENTFPQSYLYTGTAFPFRWGRIRINKNSVTDGLLNIHFYQKCGN